MKLITQQISPDSVKVKWDDKADIDLTTIYNSFIFLNATDIKTILQFERIVLQIITRIIIGYEVRELRKIIADDSAETKRIKCKLIVAKFEMYIKIF